MLTEGVGDVIAGTAGNDRPGGVNTALLTEERLASLLAYCKLTELAGDPEVQALIPLFFSAAVSYMTQAGISEPEEGTPRRAQYDLCVNSMVLDSWERRDTAITSTVVTDNPAFRQVMNQLKLTETKNVSDSDTSGGGSYGQ